MQKILTKRMHDNANMVVTVSTERGYFSVTGQFNNQVGCIHETILEHFPHLKPIVDLHLADLGGVPVHAVKNGFYWLAGAYGGLGQRFHGGNSAIPTPPEQCLKVFQSMMRLNDAGMKTFIFSFEDALQQNRDPEQYVAKWAEFMKTTWKTEAEQALKLIESL